MGNTTSKTDRVKIANYGLILGLLGVVFSVIGIGWADVSITSTDQNIASESINSEGSDEHIITGIESSKQNITCIAVLSEPGELLRKNSNSGQEDCSIDSIVKQYETGSDMLAIAGAASSNHVHYVLSDPLRDRIEPTVGECDYQNLVLREQTHILIPGVYCGGIVALSSKEIKLQPGIYVIKDGPLIIGGNAQFSGKDVGLYFHGESAVFSFGRSTQLALSAAHTGVMANILFFEARNARSNREFALRSRNADILQGAVYLPNGRLVIESNKSIGRHSNWTMIVANQVEIRGSLTRAVHVSPWLTAGISASEQQPIREIAHSDY